VPSELGRLDGCDRRVDVRGFFEFDGLILERELLDDGLVGLLKRGDPYVLIGFLTVVFGGEYCLKPDERPILLGRDGVEGEPSLVDEEFSGRRLIELGPIFDLDVAIRLGVLTTFGFPGDAADDEVVRLGVKGVTVDGRIDLTMPVLPNGRGIKVDFVFLVCWVDFSELFFFAILRPLMVLFSDLSSVVFSSLLSFEAVVLLTCCLLNVFSDEVAFGGDCSFGRYTAKVFSLASICPIFAIFSTSRSTSRIRTLRTGSRVFCSTIDGDTPLFIIVLLFPVIWLLTTFVSLWTTVTSFSRTRCLCMRRCLR